jgi:hypothetical protein
VIEILGARLKGTAFLWEGARVVVGHVVRIVFGDLALAAFFSFV